MDVAAVVSESFRWFGGSDGGGYFDLLPRDALRIVKDAAGFIRLSTLLGYMTLSLSRRPDNVSTPAAGATGLHSILVLGGFCGTLVPKPIFPLSYIGVKGSRVDGLSAFREPGSNMAESDVYGVGSVVCRLDKDLAASLNESRAADILGPDGCASISSSNIVDSLIGLVDFILLPFTVWKVKGAGQRC